jgi:hypothetical protein
MSGDHLQQSLFFLNISLAHAVPSADSNAKNYMKNSSHQLLAQSLKTSLQKMMLD